MEYISSKSYDCTEIVHDGLRVRSFIWEEFQPIKINKKLFAGNNDPIAA